MLQVNFLNVSYLLTLLLTKCFSFTNLFCPSCSLGSSVQFLPKFYRLIWWQKTNILPKIIHFMASIWIYCQPSGIELPNCLVFQFGRKHLDRKKITFLLLPLLYLLHMTYKSQSFSRQQNLPLLWGRPTRDHHLDVF